MEKNRSTRILAVIALVVAVAGLSLGFAAFSSVLTIEPSAVVLPEDNMRIIFSDVDGAPTAAVVEGEMDQAMSNARTRLAALGIEDPNLPNVADAVIDNSNKKAPKITNLKATFTAPGQSASYTFYVYNEMDYKAFLRTITFDTTKYSCTPGSGTDSTSANSVCQSIELDIAVGSATASVTGNGSSAKTEFTASTAHELTGKDAEEVVVTISYPENSPETNGDVTVRLPDIQLTYSSTSGV